MRTSALFALTILAACGSNNTAPSVDAAPPTPPPTPTANGVFPAQGFAGRDVRIEVSGDNTTWSASTTVSFGPDVTVNKVSVAGPTDLFADVTISPSAASGLVDVVVTDGSSMFKLAQAFEIDTPIGATFQGVVAQGSISVLTIQNNDTTNPFDTTSTTDANGNAVFTNIALGGPAGMNFIVETVTPFQISALALTDIDAGASGDITVASGPAGGTVVNSDAGSTTVTARTATALTAGTAANGTVTNPFDSQLFSYTPTTSVPDIQALALATANADAAPAVALLPASGHFSDLISFGASADSLNTTAGTEQFFVYWDNTGTAGYNFTIDEADVTLTHTATLAATSDSDVTATTVTLPFLGNGGDVNTATGQQWVKLTVAAAQVGKTLRVVMVGDPTSDLEIDVYASLGDAQQDNPFATCGDLGGNPVDCVTPAITTAGTYFIEMQPDPGSFFGTPTTDYILTAFFQ